MISWISEHNLLLLLSISYIFHVLWLLEFKQKLKMNTFAVSLISFLGIAAGVLGAKLLALLELGTFSGMRIYGTIFLIPILTYLVAKVFKRNIADVFDMITVPLIFSLICGRINCLFSGCCTGVLLFGTQEIAVPIRELEIILYVVLLIKLGRIVGRKPYNGMAYPIFLIVYGAFRFIVEWFREPAISIGFLHIAHIWSIMAFIIGSYIYIIIKKKEEGTKIKKKEGKKI